MNPKKTSPGMPFKFSAGFYNKLIDTVKWVDKNRNLGGAGQINPDPGETKLQMVNGGPDDLPIGSVLEITHRIGNDSTFIYSKAIKGAKPYAMRHCVITAEPIPSGSMGRVAVAGVCVARVNVLNIAHQYANPKKNSYVLESSDVQGKFRIIEPITSSTGEQYLLVAFYAPAREVTHILIQAPAGGIPGRYQMKLGKATCTVVPQNLDPDVLPDDDYIYIPANPSTAVVYNWTTQPVCTAGDRFGVAAWCNDNWYIVAEDCADEGSEASPISGSSTFGEFVNPLDPSGGAITTSSGLGFGTTTTTGGGYG